MIRTRFVVATVAALLAVLLSGCQQPQITLSDIMKQPPRPAELDKLEMLVGSWDGTSEMRLVGSDEVMTGQGSSTMSWDADRWLLVERYEHTTGEGGTMRGLGVWTWDPKAEKYRLTYFDNYGYTESGTATFEDATDTWHMKTKGRDLATGEKWVGEGTMKMVDGDTLEWKFTYWGAWKLRKFIEIEGTSRRK